MEEQRSSGESFESPDTQRRKIALVSEALALFSSSNEANQQHLVDEILPRLSEELGMVLDASQNTWELLASEKEILREKLSRLE